MTDREQAQRFRRLFFLKIVLTFFEGNNKILGSIYWYFCMLILCCKKKDCFYLFIENRLKKNVYRLIKKVYLLLLYLLLSCDWKIRIYRIVGIFCSHLG